MATVLDTLTVCVDCTLIVGQGDDRAWARDVAGYPNAVSAHVTCSEDCGDCGFSWSACEGCNSGLGGDRHTVTILGRG